MIPPKAVVASDPPRVNRGHEMVIILVGPTKRKFIADEILLCAASKFFRSALDHKWDRDQAKTSEPAQENSAVVNAETIELAQETSAVINVETIELPDEEPAVINVKKVELPEEKPTVFNIFMDWLNSGHFDSKVWCHFQPGNECHKDRFWLEVYVFADKLIIPGVQLQAFEQIKCMFSLLESTIPSTDFLKVLFKQDEYKVIQAHLIGHVVYWLPKSKQTNDWVKLFGVHKAFVWGVAKAMVAVAAADADFTHPCASEGFAARHGLDIEKLGQEARSADEKQPEDKELKVLGELSYIYDFQHWASANTQAARAEIDDKNKSATFGRLQPTVVSASNKSYEDRSKWQW
ncbi:hypothetical protein LTR10_016332 [Elasticomyces elasticus]|uniref:BTB domain-containing protein n=1 Tax=Exophiala sideris TaxID=1016849 RepID=A0ABR0J5Y5_9EURO|nr:hypothetical protein LTR10_016332 [Elasticomyces elasticus]KAK5028342.1 hypothetical protein LTS07_006433 [Exophiala sideris]KAK5036015.1 hypothetical protein LTR13_005585 [Exophiala sideris]KAK5057051.1 hypothetical protein LTR69_007689 [Exophiala sideris]KAK5181458.1 hypothetical protein LTR44_006253 [Eurotiomycetes sp. CCFEE 6388]